jgi:bacterioferritin
VHNLYQSLLSCLPLFILRESRAADYGDSLWEKWQTWISKIFLKGDSMRGNPRVLEQLNHALRDELTAINQYFLHAEMSENWGYKKYSKYIKKQSIDEMKHAEMLMERILFLDGTPTMESMSLTIGKSVKEMIESDLGLEHGAVASYNESIRICVENGDNGSRDLFVKLLRDEEGHVDWLEAQVHQIKEIGYERYLITQTEEG